MRWFKVLHILIFCVSGLAVKAQTDLSVVRAPKSIQPGSHETFVFRCTHNGGDTLILRPELVLPSDDWKVLSGPASRITLLPKSSDLLIYVVETHPSSRAGSKKLNLELYRSESDELIVVREVVTKVPRLIDMRAEFVNGPEQVPAGESFAFSYLISNRGNTVETVKVESERGRVDIGDTLIIQPGSQRTLNLNGLAPKSSQRNIPYSFYMDLTLNIDSNVWKERLMNSTKVIPLEEAKYDPHHRFPIKIGGSYVGGRSSGDYDDAYQFLVQGAGFLDQDRNHKIKLFLRGPNQFKVTRVGNFDQYALTYESGGTSVLLGDHSFRVSRLMEFGRFARGISINQRWGKWSANAMYHRPRFNRDISSIAALSGRYFVNESWNVKLTGLQKRFNEQNTAHLIGLGSEFVMRNIKFDAEVSASQQAESIGFGASADLRAKFSRFGLNVNALHSDRNYRGFFNNSTIINSNANYSIDRWSFSLNGTYNISNPSLDTFQVAAPFVTSQFLNVSYRLSKSAFLLMGVVRRTGEDRFEPKRFHYNENTVRMRFRFRKNKFQWRSEAEVGETTNLLAETGQSTQASFNFLNQFNMQLGRNFQLGGLGQYLRTNRYDQQVTNIFLYGINAGYHWNKYLSATINYRNNFLLEQVNEDRSLINSSINVNWGPHQLSGFFSYNIFRNTLDQRNYFLSLSYLYEINLALSKRKDIADLSGAILPKENQNVEGITLKFAGQTAVTDSEGQFLFRGIRPGEHQLFIDKNSLPLFDRPLNGYSRKVSLGPAEKKEIKLILTTTGQVKGRIEFELKDRQAPSHMIMRLQNEDETKVTEVNKDGSFEWIQLMPGEWSYQLLDSGWSRNFEMKSRGSVTVLPGETTEITLVMKEKEEVIQFKN